MPFSKRKLLLSKRAYIILQSNHTTKYLNFWDINLSPWFETSVSSKTACPVPGKKGPVYNLLAFESATIKEKTRKTQPTKPKGEKSGEVLGKKGVQKVSWELSFCSAKAVETLPIQLKGQEGCKVQQHVIRLYSTCTRVFTDVTLTRYSFRSLHTSENGCVETAHGEHWLPLAE